ncbi:MAG: hypothetical protein AAF191_02040, partial [Verrucomicrobiota bacterium]
VLIGTLDLDAFDLGGPEFDLDVDLDTEGGEGSSSGSEGHWFGALIRFFNLVEIPGMVFLTFASLVWWLSQVITDHYLNGGERMTFGLGLLLGNFVLGLFAAKAVTQPLRPMFKRLQQGESHIEVVGQTAVVRSQEVTEEYGQVELEKGGAPLVLNARVGEGDAPLVKGESAVVYREDCEAGTVYVKKI